MSNLLPEIKALGTIWWIEIFSEISDKDKQVVYDDLLVFISEFENKYSRFRQDSLITKLNDTRKIENPDHITIDLLQTGINLYKQTEGLFNILIGEILENRGYDANYSFLPKEANLIIPNPTEELSISQNLITLSKGRIDLGGFGKGYLIDLIVKRLKDNFNLEYFLINGGGDIYATSDNGKPIEIYLEHPIEKDTFIGTTTLFNQGFAASSPHKRKWKAGDKIFSHIVNTKEEPISIDGTFVKADTVAKADAFATVSLITTPEKIINFANKYNFSVAFIKSNDTSLFYNKNW
ncbi:MAG: Thiamine biosynthesis lipoprotein ApbE precursor [Parcubacteria bacterium OLB19]|nr:MAG: Thiamine biosynthesis lipoprotein ApbE precursor [Parcubacteria bacterium OLB19]